MKIPVVIFTFSCDAACTVFSAQAAIAAGFGPVFVEEDAAAMLPEACRRKLLAMGCLVRKTTFPRIGNLRGMATYQGMLQSYIHVFRHTGAKYLVKLDADTYIVRPDRINQAAADNVFAAAMTHGEYPFYGWCMLLSWRLVNALTRWIDEYGAFPGYRNSGFPEDEVTGTMAVKFNKGEVRRWVYDANGGFGAGYRYGHSRVPLTEYGRRFDVVTFGNRRLIPGNASSCAKRDEVAMTMLDFSKILNNLGHGRG